MIRANVVEDRQANMARFLNGLNRKITNVVELQHYVELEDMVHMATKAEEQIKRNGQVKSVFNSGSLSSWKPNLRREGTAQPKPFVPPNAEPLKAKGEVFTSSKSKSETQSKCTRDVKCFKCYGHDYYALECPNKRIIGMLNLKVTDLIVKTCHNW